MTTIASAITPVDDAVVRRPTPPRVAATWRFVADSSAAAIALGLVIPIQASLTAPAAASLTVGWVLVLWLLGNPGRARGWATTRMTLRGAATAGLLAWITTTLADTAAREALAFVVIATATTLMLRPIALRARHGLRTLVLAESEKAHATFASLAESTRGRLVPIASCTPAELDDMVARVQPDLVLALPSDRFGGRALQRATWQAEAAGVPLAVSTRLADVAEARARVERVGTLGVLHLASAPRRGLHGGMKVAWERCAALVLLAALSPVMGAIAILVRRDSAGPALFRQVRIGRDGVPFTMIKFRTMHTDAEARLAQLRDLGDGDGPLFKMREDPRITRVGRVLRKFSLDELPQLINVVRGEMALVGPRPALPSEVAEYDDDPRHRLLVRPGITGLWQVSGRSDLPWSEAVRLDLDYVDNWSIGRDLLILARTVSAVLAHRGAY